jgi:hypothetical protein
MLQFRQGAAASSVSERSYCEVDDGDDTAREGTNEKPSKKAIKPTYRELRSFM